MNTSSSSTSAPTSSGPSLQNFWRLPNELQQRILSLACQSPAATVDAATQSPLALDIPTTLRLMLSTRRLYPHTASLLYRNVKITTVSALQLLQRTLSGRPALGRLVKSLHFGSSSDLADEWWPIYCACYDYVGGSIETWEHQVLTSLDDQSQLPRWCRTRASLEIRRDNDGANADCHHRAIWSAVTMALKGANVDPYRPHCDAEGNGIGRDCWAIRVWEAQAAVDLYLIRMRQVEDDKDYPALNWKSPWHKPRCSGKNCHPYPKLVLTATPRQETEDTFYVAVSQLHQHLARRGSATERLDSPLHLARSGLLMFDYHQREPAREIRDDPYVVRGRQGSDVDDKQPGDFADLFAVTEGEGYARAPHASSSAAALDPALPATPTIGSLLAQARSILSYTSALQNLSLSGFLERLVCGRRSPAELKNLRAVTIGPPPPQWRLPLHFNGATFATIEKLRICGTLLTQDNLDALIGVDNQLPALRKFQYSTVARSGSEDTSISEPPQLSPADAMYSLILGLSGVSEAKQLEGEARRKKRRREDDGDGTSNATRREGEQKPLFPASRYPSRRTQPLYIDARLHPEEVKKLLGKAPSPAVRDAWVKGATIPGHFSQHQLRVVEMTASAKEVDKESDFEPPKVPQQLFDEGLEWWAECAKRSGGR